MERSAMSPCIEWMKSRDRRGYGVQWFQGRTHRAHRVAWMEANGPIPEGMYVCHHCDNPPCVNVEHLFLGTQVDNMHDMVVKGRSKGQPPGERHPMAKLSAADIEAIRLDPRSQSKIAAQYGCSRGHIGRIKNGKRWASS